MRILNVIASIDPAFGGPIEGAMRLSDIWRSNGHVADFVTLDAPEAPYLGLCQGQVAALGKFGGAVATETHLSLTQRFGYSPRLVPWLRKNVARYDAAVVHALWNYATMGAGRVLAGGTTPYFVFPHGCLDPWFKQADPRKHLAKTLLWPLTEGRLMNGASSVLFTTEEERVLATDIFRPWHIRSDVVGFGSSDVSGDAEAQKAAFRALLPRLGDRPFLLFLSRLHRKKGCDLLIRAFAKVAHRYPDLDLVMAGPDQTGWQAELEALAAELGVAERIHWPGMIKGDAKWGAFHACEAFALTSHTENFGIVVAEALACAKPVLITDKVNLWREVAEDGAGLVEPDTQDGADTLVETFLAMGSDARRAMEARGRQCFENHFRMESAAGKILSVMKTRGAPG
jgi:glycosyltransferase involved in cell wall biosynthesis